MMADFINVSGLLYPKSIAVIGASGRAGDLGGDTVQHLVRFGFPGKVWVVNPDGRSVQGVRGSPGLPTCRRCPISVILAIPADSVAETIRACAAHGTRHGMAFAGGFADSGGEGVALQNELGMVCRDVGFTLCGPNCVGIINAATPVTATFAAALSEFDTLRAGPISMVTQSGGIGSTIFSMVQRAGFGFRHLISSGNEAVVRFADYLYALAHDDGTRIIAAYLKRIGDAARLVRALKAARRPGQKDRVDQGGCAHPHDGRRRPQIRRNPSRVRCHSCALGRGARRRLPDAYRYRGCQGAARPRRRHRRRSTAAIACWRRISVPPMVSPCRSWHPYR